MPLGWGTTVHENGVALATRSSNTIWCLEPALELERGSLNVVLTRCAGLDVHRRNITACAIIPWGRDLVAQRDAGRGQLRRVGQDGDGLRAGASPHVG